MNSSGPCFHQEQRCLEDFKDFMALEWLRAAVSGSIDGRILAEDTNKPGKIPLYPGTAFRCKAMLFVAGRGSG